MEVHELRRNYVIFMCKGDIEDCVWNELIFNHKNISVIYSTVFLNFLLRKYTEKLVSYYISIIKIQVISDIL